MTENRKRGSVPVKNLSGFAQWRLPKLGTSPPTEVGTWGLCLWFAKINYIFGSLESSWGCAIELSETVLVFARLWRPGLRPSREGAQRGLARVWSRGTSLSEGHSSSPRMVQDFRVLGSCCLHESIYQHPISTWPRFYPVCVYCMCQ